MFEANNEEKKLDWMYKGPGSSVDREEYLLGRSVDKSLEQLNTSEKLGSDLKPPKNHVEHECIPPSIRDFHNLTSGEQVDLAQKLQEDPLVAIKKQEEETRRKLLQNPVQLKKLQNVLKMKTSKKKKKKNKRKCKKSKFDLEDIDAKLAEKYFKLKDHLVNKKHAKSKKSDKDDLDYLIGKKIKSLREKMSKKDLEKLLNMNCISGDSTDDEEKNSKHSKTKSSNSRSGTDSDNRKKHSQRKRSLSDSDVEDNQQMKLKHANTDEFRNLNFNKVTKSYRKRHDYDSTDESDVEHNIKKIESKPKSGKIIKDDKYKNRPKLEERAKTDRHQETSKHNYKLHKSHHPKRSSSHSPVRKNKNYKSSNSDESDNDNNKIKKVNYGLVKADGTKIPFSKNPREKDRSPVKRTDKEAEKYEEKKVERHKRKKLSEEEIEHKRREMQQNAEWRDKERISNVKKYKEHDKRESKVQEYNPEFLKSEFLKSANSSTVESRIKSNINNIQRSKKDMNSHFSRRY